MTSAAKLFTRGKRLASKCGLCREVSLYLEAAEERKWGMRRERVLEAGREVKEDEGLPRRTDGESEWRMRYWR